MQISAVGNATIPPVHQTHGQKQMSTGVIRRDINCRKPHQRICRNARFMAVKIKVDSHEGSLHEAGRDVNFEK